MVQSTYQNRATLGLLGFLLAIVSLLVIMIQMSGYFEPQPKNSGSVIGEIAAEIKLSAKRALTGEPAPVPEPAPREFGPIITIAALSMAGLAIVLGGLGLYRHEPQQLSYMAVGFGISAFLLQYLFWLAMLICGVALLISIIGNLDSILE